jgi:pilus assembly protein CpaF
MNFKKAGIFRRSSEGSEQPEVQNDSGGMLAVWGSPGSGKTVTAVKIAKMLSAKKKNVILLLCDMTAPMLPCICSPDELECERSLGNILAAARIGENLIKHMLHASGMVLDNASPLVTGHLTRNTRIAAMKSPVVDEDVGVAASIRIVNRHNLSREDLLRSGTATEEMLDWLSVFLRYGISICVAGATSSGKTTAAGWLLTTIPDSKRIFTIENGSRELELVREENGKVVNSVVHTLTRDSENERQRIDQIALVDICLRFNPDILVVGEMRGAEANAAQEAARVGVAVLTTIHSNSCEATYRRMVSLCKRAVDMSDETLLSYVTEAYPIVVFCKQLENKQRRMMEIMECEILPNGDRRYNTLFRYIITENHMKDGKFVIEGHHTQVNEISVSLRKRLLENGMPNEELQTLLKPKKEVNAT